MTSRLKKSGFKVHAYDATVFMYPSKRFPGSPSAVLLVYVDDFLVT